MPGVSQGSAVFMGFGRNPDVPVLAWHRQLNAMSNSMCDDGACHIVIRSIAAIASPPRSSPTRCGCISGFLSVCGWSRACWLPVGSLSPIRQSGSGRRNSAAPSPTRSAVDHPIGSEINGTSMRPLFRSVARSIPALLRRRDRSRQRGKTGRRRCRGAHRFYRVPLGNSDRHTSSRACAASAAAVVLPAGTCTDRGPRLGVSGLRSRSYRACRPTCNRHGCLPVFINLMPSAAPRVVRTDKGPLTSSNALDLGSCHSRVWPNVLKNFADTRDDCGTSVLPGTVCSLVRAFHPRCRLCGRSAVGKVKITMRHSVAAGGLLGIPFNIASGSALHFAFAMVRPLEAFRNRCRGQRIRLGAPQARILTWRVLGAPRM